jgi:predicted outer membrane repeat protein
MSASTITLSGKAIVNDCLASNNGGAVFVNESSTLTVSDYVQMTGNSAGNEGGGVYAEGDATAVNLQGACKLSNVSALCMCVCVFICCEC